MSAPSRPQGRFVSLGPVTQTVLPQLARIILEAAEVGRWRLDRMTGGDDALLRSLTAGVAKQRVVVHRQTGQVIGLCQLLNVDWRSLRGELTVLLAPEYWGRAWPIEGVALFVGEVFTSTPLRKFTAEVSPAVLDSLRSGRDKFFQIDGVLTQAQYLDGRYVDLTYISISRDRWPFERLERFSRLSPELGSSRRDGSGDI